MRKLLSITFLLSFCLFTFQCQKALLPVGVFPSDGHTISKKFAKRPIFNWTPMEFRDGRSFSYRIQISEVDSVANNEGNIEYYFNTLVDQNVKVSSFRYSSEAPRLQEGKVYAWKVNTVDQYGAEITVKELTSFAVGNVAMLKQTLPGFSNFCTECYDVFDSQGNCFEKCVTIYGCDPGTVIHIATGSLSLSPPNPPTKAAQDGSIGAPGYNGNCYELAPQNTLYLSCKYKLLVPDDKFNQMPASSSDSIILKVFENQSALSQNDVFISNYLSLENSTADRFIVTKNDYELVCIDNVPYRQATIFINLSFKMKTQPLSTFYRNYEVIIDLVPINNAVHFTNNTPSKMHSHTSSAPVYPSQCPGITRGSYQYYRCLDDNEDQTNGHQGKHIVRLPIPSNSICGLWNISSPYPAPDSGGSFLGN